MKIVAHTLVKNEENWVWYSLMSVVDWVDEVMVWDTGSTDNTVDVIKSIPHPKIKFRQVKADSKAEIAQIRQDMLDATTADWIFLVDADEIWTREGLQEIREFVTHPGGQTVGVHRFWSLVGDVLHYLPERYGKYHVGHQTGHLTIRLMRHLPDLHVTGQYTFEGYGYSDTPVQSLSESCMHHFNHKFFHTTFLPRSSNNSPLFQRRIRYQFGPALTADYPEVFYLSRSDFIRSPWLKHDIIFWINAFWQTPLKLLRNILLGTTWSTSRPSS